MLLLLQSVLGIARKNARRYQIAGDSTKKAGRPTDRQTLRKIVFCKRKLHKNMIAAKFRRKRRRRRPIEDQPRATVEKRDPEGFHFLEMFDLICIHSYSLRVSVDRVC